MTDIAEQLQGALADRYQLGRKLGQGGMATVWLARDLRHERDVALKVLRPELSAVLGADRFLSEIRIAARLDHPHILTLIDSGASDGILWYVIPYVRGENLRQRLEHERQLGLDEAVSIARQVLGALDYAHRQGVVHRDVKPENILFQEGEAVLADFGIALALREAGGNRLTETGLSLGTPQYMSPEQATGDRALDARSDIYSLGAVLYEMLTGEPPHSGATVQAVIAKLMTERPTSIRTVRDTVSPELEAAVTRALAKVPADRWPSASDFSHALEGAHGRAPARVPAPSRRLLIAGALLLVVGAAAAFALTSRLADQPTSRPLAQPVSTQFTFSGDVSAPSISPDGQRLAFVRQLCDSGGVCNHSLVVQDLGGAGALTLLNGWAGIYFVEWSSDGRWLLAAGTDPAARYGTFILPSLGGSHRFVGPVAAFLGGPDTLLVLPEPDRRDGTTWWRVVTSRDGVVRDSIPVRPEGLSIPGIRVAPGGQLIGAIGVNGEGQPSMLVIDRAGAIRDRWEPDGYTLWDADWQDQHRIIFQVREAGGSAKYLVRRDVNSSRARFDGPPVRLARLDDGFVGPISLSADGRTLAGGVASASRRVVTLKLDPRTRLLRVERQVAAFTGNAGAQVAPSGSSVAIYAPAPGGPARRSIVLQPFGGGRPDEVLVPPTDSIFNVEWAPDRDVMYYATPGDSGLTINEADASTKRSRVVGAIAARVDGLADFEPLQRGGFAWLEDGDPAVHFQLPGEEPQRLELPGIALNFTSSAPGGFGLALIGWTLPGGDSIKIFVADLRARTTREVWAGVVEDAAVAWLPDGSMYATLTERQGTRAGWTIYTDGRPPVRHGLVPFARATYRIAADGIHGSALVTDLTSDAWLLRNWDPETKP